MVLENLATDQIIKPTGHEGHEGGKMPGLEEACLLNGLPGLSLSKGLFTFPASVKGSHE